MKLDIIDETLKKDPILIFQQRTESCLDKDLLGNWFFDNENLEYKSYLPFVVIFGYCEGNTRDVADVFVTRSFYNSNKQDIDDLLSHVSDTMLASEHITIHIVDKLPKRAERATFLDKVLDIIANIFDTDESGV